MFQLKWIWENMKGRRCLFVMGIIISAVTSIATIINPKLSQVLVDEVIVGVKNAGGVTVHKTGLLIPLLLMMVGTQLAISSLRYLMIIFFEKSSQFTLLHIRDRLYDNLQKQDMHFYDSYRTGDLMTRLTGDLDLVRHFMAWIVYNITDSVVLYTATIVYFFTISWKLTLALLATSPFIFVVAFIFSRKVGPMFAALREKLSQLNTTAQESISGNRVIKAFHRQGYEIEQFRRRNDEFREQNLKISYAWLKYFPVLEGLAQLLTVITVLLGGLLIMRGELTYGELMAFSMLTWGLANPMRMLGQILNDAQRFGASASKVIELYYAKPDIVSPAEGVDTPERLRGEIEFENVTFGYGDEAVLENFSLVIGEGETVGIMGATGSGKTTIANLITRFYDISEGRVLVDGVDVRDYDLRTLRANVGMATQDVFLFSETIDGNIAYGKPDMPELQVHAYAHIADADSFIKQTSDGYNTVVGERGVGLSGGQKQRLALARAIAVRPAILILDDTTSAVDMETESRIQQNLKKLDFTCTKIIIAQRITSVKDADKIVMLGHHGISEIGTHEELMRKRGDYYRVYCLQQGEGTEGFHGAQ